MYKKEAQFKRSVLGYYRKNGRVLPWRPASLKLRGMKNDPYKIVVSEIMLQQTQVARVIPKYKEFVATFPTIEALADASLQDVLRLWQGLGYNRRGQALWRLAKEVVLKHEGKIPRDTETLQKLPGIGSYTAGAVRVFAFDLPAVCVETNIRTALLYHFFPNARKGVDDKILLKILERIQPKKDFRTWYWALMDYGAYLKGRGIRLNHQSKHYTKQSKFKGSRRELRGFIIKSILESPQTKKYLIKNSRREVKEVEEELRNLIKEGLIKRRLNRFSISNIKV